MAKENTLTIRGEKNAKEEEKRGDVLYQGIAARTFERVFQLADFVLVKGASLENGLLHVDLVREIPEAKKPRAIPINVQGNGPGHDREREGRRLSGLTEANVKGAPRLAGALFILPRSSRQPWRVQ